MQVIAMGRWSKSDKQWKTVVALRRANASVKGAKSTRVERDNRDRDDR